MPPQEEPYSTDPDQLADEIELTVYRSSGPGGQHKNTTESAVRIHHPPSGVTVIATEHRSQLRNRKLALERLIERLEALNRRPKKRKPTRVPRAARERRKQNKKALADKKRMRKAPKED